MIENSDSSYRRPVPTRPRPTDTDTALESVIHPPTGLADQTFAQSALVPGQRRRAPSSPDGGIVGGTSSTSSTGDAEGAEVRVDPDTTEVCATRWAVVDRLALIGRRQARHLTELAHSPHKPAEHVVAFLYRPRRPTSRPGRTVWAATRMFADEEIREATGGRADLPTVLRTLHARGRDFLNAGHFDPLTHMTNHHDTELSHDTATYLGVATSTITAETTPGDLDSHRASGTRRTWRGLAKLVDNTELVLRVADIDDNYGLHAMEVESSRRLIPLSDSHIAERPWYWFSPDGLPTGLTSETRATLGVLHSLITAPALHRGAR